MNFLVVMDVFVVYVGYKKYWEDFIKVGVKFWELKFSDLMVIKCKVGCKVIGLL